MEKPTLIIICYKYLKAGVWSLFITISIKLIAFHMAVFAQSVIYSSPKSKASYKEYVSAKKHLHFSIFNGVSGKEYGKIYEFNSHEIWQESNKVNVEPLGNEEWYKSSANGRRNRLIIMVNSLERSVSNGQMPIIKKNKILPV